VTAGERRLEAPHRRGAARPAIVERTAVLAYRATSWLLAVLPAGFARAVVGLLAQGSYLAWPGRRRWSNSNFGHVLGLPPDDRRVRAMALRAYREYARYLVELMRLPSLPPDEVGRLVGNLDEEEAELRGIWAGARGGGLIFSAAHIGNNEAIAAGAARRGLPISVVADDTSFAELYELLRQQRATWGVTLIPWRNLRAIFGVLRRGEILGLLIDWGYRSDGIPVRLFDAWTTLPAGPATLAAKTGARILPVAVHRGPDGRFALGWEQPIDVASNDPAELQRATQAMADALADSIRVAPHQWYSFKPVWPEGAAESADLERRARLMQAGQADPGPGRDIPRDAADQVGADPVEELAS
jgi:phosphatidylinositol dimannoside acyltransferase